MQCCGEPLASDRSYMNLAMQPRCGRRYKTLNDYNAIGFVMFGHFFSPCLSHAPQEAQRRFRKTPLRGKWFCPAQPDQSRSSSSPEVCPSRYRARSKWHRSRPPAYLVRVSMVPELFDVVHQAVKLSLPIHLIPPAQREAGEPFVVPQVAEHGFYGGKPRGDHPFAFRGIDAPLHPIGM